MSPEDQRIAIGKAYGLRFEDREYETPWPESKKYRAGGWYKNDVFIGSLPDYPNDLNAMHEAERILTFDQACLYDHKLLHFSNGVRATAAQRAEMFLQTLGLLH